MARIVAIMPFLCKPFFFCDPAGLTRVSGPALGPIAGPSSLWQNRKTSFRWPQPVDSQRAMFSFRFQIGDTLISMKSHAAIGFPCLCFYILPDTPELVQALIGQDSTQGRGIDVASIGGVSCQKSGWSVRGLVQLCMTARNRVWKNPVSNETRHRKLLIIQ